MTSRAATRGGARGLLLSTSFGPSPLTRGGARPWPAGSVSVFVAVSSRSHHHVLAASARGAPTRPSGPPRPALEGALIPTNKGGNLGGTGLPRTAAAAPSDSGRDCGGILTRAAALGLRTSRRYFSIRPRCLERDGKSAREQSPQQEAEQTALGKRSLRDVLPKSISALTPHENIYTVPNLLTFSRIIAAPFVGYAILHDAHAWALGLFVYAGVSDLLDGWIARRWKLQTVVGSVIDPMADKMLMTILTVCLATKGALPVWLAAIILGRDVGLAISAIYYRWISLPPPKTFTRYWDFSLPSAEVRPTTISKYNTFLQLALMGATTVAPLVTGIEVRPALVGLQYIVATTTVWSGLSYVFSKDAVKILSDAKDQKQLKDQKQAKDQKEESEKP